MPDSRRSCSSRRDGGGASIVHPSGRRLAGPLIGEEGILYAEADLTDVASARLDRDLTGNYNRFDIFKLVLDRRTPASITVLDDPDHKTEDAVHEAVPRESCPFGEFGSGGSADRDSAAAFSRTDPGP